MKCKNYAFQLCFAAFSLLCSFSIRAEIHPVLFKDQPDLYSKIYFGMGFDEFKTKVGSSIFECKEYPNKNLADKGCKVSFKFGDSGISSGLVMFKNDLVMAVFGKINTDFYGNFILGLSTIYKEQPQSESRDEKKGVFSNKISNEYSIWSYPDYLMIISKFDIPNYSENGTNFMMAIETTNSSFISQMQEQSKKKSNINIQSKIAAIDISKLHLTFESQTNTGENKVETSVTSNEPKLVKKNKTSSNSVAVIPPSTTQAVNLKTTIIDRSLLTYDMSIGAKKEQFKEKVAFCSKDDKFLTDFRKNFPKYNLDEYCVGSNLVKDVQANTIFLLKDGLVKSIIHHANAMEFHKLSILYKETIGNEPKTKQTYKGIKPISCFSDEGLSDYVEFCKQDADGFALIAGDAIEINSGLQNRAKFMQILRGVSITPPANLQRGALIVNDVKKTSKKTKEIAKNDVLKNEKSGSSKVKWELEPKSFMGITLNEPLISSINEQCPSSTQQVCYEVNKILDSSFLEIHNPPISQFRAIYINALGANKTDPNANVGKIEVSFNTDDFETIRNILIQKYGLPHSTNVSIVKTNGGAEFKNYENYWLGNNVNIVIESLISRGYTSGKYGGFYSYGTILITTKEFLEQSDEARTNKAKSEADKL
ncbi:MAG: hypothetical protein HOP25_03825 [Methylotenera sp.]|nr:hypothetical protein [Methylotenera sp.]